MNTIHHNPYESPGEPSDSSPTNRIAQGGVRVFFAVSVGLAVGITVFLTLTLSFFANSEAYWPGVVCGIPAAGIGLRLFWAIAFPSKRRMREGIAPTDPKRSEATSGRKDAGHTNA